MTNITSAQLKKHFANFSKEEMVREVAELSRTFSEVRELYQSKLTEGGSAELLEKYKGIVEHEFFPAHGFGKARLSVARKAVTDFKKLNPDMHSVADIMLYYAEMGVRFTSEYGDIDEPFYNSMESMYEAAALFVTEHKIGQQYQARFEKMVADTSGIGWGFHDQLTYLYEKYFSTKGRDVGEQKIL